jgi:hypothetical protein
MVPGLYPSDLFEQAFKRVPFHWQNDFEKDLKLRQRNRRCFFFPS